ncbi:MAG: DUF2271 domain-containing protein [bacterium]
MKFKVISFVPVTIYTFLVSQLISLNAVTGAEGTVTFQVRTVSYGGEYAEKNIGAIWVEDSQNKFVKTLNLWAAKRKGHLIKWNAASGGNVVDAVTSATLRTHETHNVTWNGTDINGNRVPDGTYKILVEFTEDNSNKSGQPPGKWTSIEFSKGSSPQNITPANETYFKDMELVYAATNSTNTSMNGTVQDAATGAPLENATVQLKEGNVVRYEITSNASGLYSINNIQAGTYKLVCSKQGYETWMEDVNFNAGEPINGKNILLTPTSDTTAPSPPKNVRVELNN